MAIKISDTTIIDDSRNATNLINVSAASSVTAVSFYGDGSNLSGIAVNTNMLVVGRSANSSVPVSSGSLVIVGRTGDIAVPV
jgi:hypothetical protein